jgi:hypothetical protein
MQRVFAEPLRQQHRWKSQERKYSVRAFFLSILLISSIGLLTFFIGYDRRPGDGDAAGQPHTLPAYSFGILRRSIRDEEVDIWTALSVYIY